MDTEDMGDVGLGDSMNDTTMGDTMDDLFGETANGLDLGEVDVNLPTVGLPPPPALLRRLSEMQTLGCCTRLAWSNTGSIANIVENGAKVKFRIFSRHLESRKWALSTPSKHDIVAPADCRFVHLQFNYIGQDLALTDNLGRVHLYSMSGGNGKMSLVSPESVDEQDGISELDAIVGLHWLPIYPLDCRSLYIGPASRSITGWTSTSRTREPNAVKVHHPADNSRALLYVSRRGNLTLRYQKDGWRSITSSLDTFTSSESLLTHADLCEHQGGLLLAVVDTTQSLRLFSIGLVWNATYVPGPNQTQQVSTVSPELQITSLTALPTPLPHHMDHARLVQLSLVPTTAEVVDQNLSTSTTVLATYIRTAISGHAQFQESSTVIVRWQVESETPVLHKGFRNLKSSSQTSTDTSSKTFLQRQPDLVSSKILLSVQSKCFDSILACIASDGTVEFRDRSTFELLDSYTDADHVNSLPQSGFSYAAGNHNTDAAISYDGAVMVAIGPDKQIDAHTMIFQYGWQRIDDSAESSSLAEAAIVCLARQYMTMTCSSISPDDVLSLLPQPLPDDLQTLLLQEIFRLARNPDISAMNERTRQNFVFREQLLPRAYSVLLSLGTNSNPSGRSLTSQYAWALLNLRHICLTISQVTMKLHPTEPFASELVHSLRGHARWSVDLMVYMLNSLSTVKDIAIRDLSQPARGVFESYMHEANDPTLMLLLCSYPRTLLKILIQYLPRLIKLSQVAIGRARSVGERQQLREVGMLEKTVPFTFEAFKILLDQTETALNSGPAPTASEPERSRSSPDLVMTLTGNLPEELEQPLRALLISAIPSALQDADVTKIYFADNSWLGLGGRKSIEVARTYDVLKKTIISPGAKLRRCRRCGSVMEDLSFDRPRDIAQWLMGTQRYCVCTCTWYVP